MADKNAEIAIIIGTRAELIKTFPVMLELQKKKVPYYFIHTGQHALLDLCKKFGVHAPDVILTREPSGSSKFYSKAIKGLFWNFMLVFKIKKQLAQLKDLNYVVYHGDTMTTASAAIASSKLLNPGKKFKNVHLEAGLRSGNIREPFPEEIARKIADRYSDILLAVSERAKENLKKHRGRVILTGNTIIDTVDIAYKKALEAKIKPLSKEKFALISIHRHENIKNKKRMQKIVKILSSLEMPSYFTLHDNTKRQLIKFGLFEKIRENPNIRVIEPIDYINFVYQLKNCSLIVCDGGSMQEESLIFGKPCIILRKATERQEGLDSNFQFLSNLDVPKTINKIKEFSSKNFRVRNIKNPYGQKNLSKKIVEEMK